MRCYLGILNMLQCLESECTGKILHTKNKLVVQAMHRDRFIMSHFADNTQDVCKVALTI